MEDRYLRAEESKNRLLRECLKHGGLIVYFDFDNTIYDYHNIGDTYPKVINILKECSDKGFSLVCFTANKDVNFVKQYISDLGIIIKGVNIDIINVGNGVKPYFNILLDDRCGLRSAIEDLEFVLENFLQVKNN